MSWAILGADACYPDAVVRHEESPCRSPASGPPSSGPRGETSSSSSSRPIQGSVGVGEVRPLNKTDLFVAAVEELAGRYVVGSDPFDTERLAWAVEWLEYGRPSEHGQSALAAFDIASWDIIGQTLGVPIWKLLGGRFRDRVPAYANGWYKAISSPTGSRSWPPRWWPAATGR